MRFWRRSDTEERAADEPATEEQLETEAADDRPLEAPDESTFEPNEDLEAELEAGLQRTRSGFMSRPQTQSASRPRMAGEEKS